MIADDKSPKLPVSIREFADEVIRESPGNLDELRASMREFGWIKQLPVLQDENGVTLVGHRRLQVASELGIEPVIVTITFGTGTAADADRLKLALASNLGGKDLSKDDRRRIAERLYGSGEWTMTKIGEALGASFATIQRDLSNLPAVNKIGPPGRGRPKGSVIDRRPVTRRPPPVAQQPANVGDDRSEPFRLPAELEELDELLDSAREVLGGIVALEKLPELFGPRTAAQMREIDQMRREDLSKLKGIFDAMENIIWAGYEP